MVSTERVSPHLVRIVLGGDGLAGFAAGEFTDHYVKLQLPPQGASYPAPFDAEEVKAAIRASTGRERGPTPCARGTASAAS